MRKVPNEYIVCDVAKSDVATPLAYDTPKLFCCPYLGGVNYGIVMNITFSIT